MQEWYTGMATPNSRTSAPPVIRLFIHPLYMPTEKFYANLPILEKFIDLANSDYYQNVPDNWYAVVTDVTGSTAAIEAGRYKDVNFLGASSIIAIINALHPMDIPFVFGGDGASLLIPPKALEKTRNALLGLRYMAAQSFDMDLRVGIVPVALIQQQHTLKIAKVKITPNYAQASFIGGGITYATDLVKQNAKYRLDTLDDKAVVDLSGMQCRWQEVCSFHGNTLSLIVAAMPDAPQSGEQIYHEVLKSIQQIYGGEKTYHPIRESTLRLSFSPQKLWTEVRALSPSPHWIGQSAYLLKLLVGNFLGSTFIQMGLKVAGVDWGKHKTAVILASDYQKIDDVLRMVIAGTPEQTTQLESYLEKRSQAGELVYGIHISNRALLTCLIANRNGFHIHLVDAADGGYALAAKKLKSSLINHPAR